MNELRILFKGSPSERRAAILEHWVLAALLIPIPFVATLFAFGLLAKGLSIGVSVFLGFASYVASVVTGLSLLRRIRNQP
jgi:hypothetical protein